MLDVTIGAREFRIGIRCVMCWAVVASQASRIRGRRGKAPGLSHMANRALLLQYSVRFTQSSTRIDAIVVSEKMEAHPHQRNNRSEYREPQLCSLERSRPLEIIQVDPLSDRFGCSCSRHR
jgi:hypothetical protein